MNPSKCSLILHPWENQNFLGKFTLGKESNVGDDYKAKTCKKFVRECKNMSDISMVIIGSYLWHVRHAMAWKISSLQ